MEGRIRQLESILEHAEIIEAPEPGVVGPGHDRHHRLRRRQRRRRRALPRRPHRGEDRRPRGRQPDRAARRRADRPPHRRLRRVRDADRRPAAGPHPRGGGSLTDDGAPAPSTPSWRRSTTLTVAPVAPRTAAAGARGRAVRRHGPPARARPVRPARRRSCCCTAGRRSADLNFYTCYDALGEHFRVLAFDHRGHGRGIRTRRRFRLEDCADDVAELLAVERRRPGRRRRLLDGRRRRPAAVAPPPRGRSAASCWRRRRPSSRPATTTACSFLGLARPRPPGPADPGPGPDVAVATSCTSAARPPTGRRGPSRRRPRHDWRMVLEAGGAHRLVPVGRRGSARSTCRRRSSSRCRTRSSRCAARSSCSRRSPAPGRSGSTPTTTPSSPVPTAPCRCSSRPAAVARLGPSRLRRRALAALGDRHRRRRGGDRRRPSASSFRRTRLAGPINRTTRAGRNLELARLGVAVGSTYAATNARKLFASAERRAELDDAARAAHRRAGRRAARQHEGRPDEGRPDGQLPRRRPARAGAPGARRAAGGGPADVGRPRRRGRRARARPRRRTSCSSSGIRSRSPPRRSARSTAPSPSTRPPATSGPSPSRCSTRASARRSRPTCANTELLGTLLKQGFGGLDPADMVAEIKERITEELDYGHEAANQQRFAAFYRGHPFIHVPGGAAVAVDRPGADQRARRRRAVARGARRGTSTSATSPARRCSASCSAASTGCAPSTATRTPATTSSTATGGSRSSTSAWSATSAPTSWPSFASMVRTGGRRARRRPRSAASSRTPGCCAADAPVPTDEAGEYFSQFYEPVADDRMMTWTPGVRQRHRAPHVRPLAARSPSTPPCRGRSCSSSASTSGCTPCSATCGRPATTGGWPRSCGRSPTAPPSTPLGEAEAAWLQARGALTTLRSYLPPLASGGDVPPTPLPRARRSPPSP